MLERIKGWIAKALDLLDRILAVLRVKLAFFKPYSPSFAPTYWIYINGSCCLVTAMFFLLGSLPDKTFGFEIAHTFYIPFNLLICSIWIVEAYTWMIFDEEEPAWKKIGEVALATFFILDGIVWVCEWLFTDSKLHRTEILIYNAIDFFIYLFYLAVAIRTEAKALRKEQERSGTDVESGESATQATGDKEAKSDFELMG